ncbi:hypothetical protein KSB_77530 [Ktedonobacter robiniae]|uniref:Restriction endonuclease type IV Mrr domain-containing protein n=1 Tax=Ktedonobacter robiniae TaxID=2778365 RepID=A0ABQ3V2U2_9CHLR|nr:hypothetical protein KSB_77530 [Ktedonobacter robiniae]
MPPTLREVYKRLKPKDFEIFSAALIIAQKEGHRFLEHCGQSGDQGVDTKLLNRFGNIVIVQSKLYASTNRVGQPELRDFFGSTYHHKSVYGYFVTTSTFTRAARQFIYANGSRIRVIDGPQIEMLLQKKRQNIALALRDIYQQISVAKA